MTLKVSYLFTLGRQTWAETHYLLGGADPDGDTEQKAVEDLALLRAALLGVNAKLTAARISTVTPPQNVTVLRFAQGGLGGQGDALGGNQGGLTADIANTEIMLDFKTNPSNKRGKIYLAGIIDVAVETDPAFPNDIQPTPLFNGAWSNYRKKLVGPLWGTRIKQNLASAQVLNLVVDGTGLAVLGVQVPAPLGAGPTLVHVGSRIQVRGFRRRDLSLPDVNGTWQVDALVNGVGGLTTYYLRNSVGIDPSNFVVKGKAQTIDPTYEAYKDIELNRAGSRKRGGSIGLRRGRLKTRR